MDAVLAFPPYFPALHGFLTELRASPLARGPAVVRRWLPSILKFSSEGVELALPPLVEMFQRPETRLGAIDLFDGIAAWLGRRATQKMLLRPVMQMHESQDEEVMLKLLEVSDRQEGWAGESACDGRVIVGGRCKCGGRMLGMT